VQLVLAHFIKLIDELSEGLVTSLAYLPHVHVNSGEVILRQPQVGLTLRGQLNRRLEIEQFVEPGLVAQDLLQS